MRRIIITVLLIIKYSWSLPLDQLYPFGADENDQMLNSSSAFISTDFHFDSFSKQGLYIRPNGILRFTSPDDPESPSTDTPMPFPIEDLDVIAPYWFDSGFPLNTCNDFNETGDLNTTLFINETSFTNETLFANETTVVNETSNNTTGCRYSSVVYYRNSFSFSLRERARSEIRAAFFGAGRNFFVRRLLIITWVITDALGDSQKYIFQCILANDGPSSYVIFNYADGLSLPIDELNVQAGINAAFRPTANFVSIPNTSNISFTSNVGIPGVWMFQATTRPFTTPFPPVDVTIKSSDEQIVGQSFTMECRVGPAMNIDYTFDIVWIRQIGVEVRSVNNIPGSLLSNYSDFFTIPVLTASDQFTTYRCEVVVNFNQPSTVGSTDFTLDSVTQPAQLIISPMQSPLRVTVGGHLPIYCIAVKGVPIPEVQWHSDGLPVYPLSSFYQQIYVVPTDSPHTTTYTCVGITYNGGVETSELMVNVTVIVEEPCPRLRAPRRGEVTITEDGQLAFFSCNRGFSMRGSSVLKCSNGQWDSTPPTCRFIPPFCRQRCNF